MKAVIALVVLNVLLFACGLSFPLHDSSQLITYGFSHANWLHLAINMLALLMFGLPLARHWGSMTFVILYLVCIVIGGYFQLVCDPAMPAVGASAGIVGLMIAYGMQWPEKRVLLFFVPMRARTMVLAYVGVEAALILFGMENSVAHWAHLGGATAGFVAWWVFR